jgi:hypothetical protein
MDCFAPLAMTGQIALAHDNSRLISRNASVIIEA